MRALIWKEKDTILTGDRQKPVPKKGEALIRVLCTGICGSDLTIISGKHPRARPPLILGHEFMGEISSLPEGYSGTLSIGHRVTVEPLLSCGVCKPCREGNEHVCKSLRLIGVETDGAFADYVAAPVGRIYPLQDTISDEEGAMIEPLAVAVHAVETSKIKPGESAVIFGAGPIGLLCAMTARALGCSRILVMEIDEKRIERAGRLGFTVFDTSKADCLQAVMDFTNGEGADVTIDAAGVPEVGTQLIPVTGIKGRIIIVALYKKPCEIFFRHLSYSEQTILGTRIYAKGDYQKAIRLLEEKKVPLSEINTHIYKWDDIHEAFRIAGDTSASCKVVVKISGDSPHFSHP